MTAPAVPKSTGSTSISFGLVSVPIKIYTATSSQNVRFSTLHKKCGGKIKQKIVCPTCDENVAEEDKVKGYEIAKHQYVEFTAEELAACSPEQFKHLALEAFVPAEQIDPVLYAKSQFIGPDMGGQRAFNLLTRAMRDTGTVGIGRYFQRGVSYLALIRPYGKGLMLHHLWYDNEVRDYEGVPLGEDEVFSEDEQALALQLIESKRGDFDHAAFKEPYREAVKKAAADKADGKVIAVAPSVATKETVTDLFSALKASLEAEKPKKKAKAPKKKKATKKAKKAG